MSGGAPSPAPGEFGAGGLGAAARADREGLARRHPAHLRPPVARRLPALGVLALMLALAALAVWRLDVDASRLVSGVARLGDFVVFMLPPHPGSWARAALHLRSLAETVAIALLGTALAAVLAFPLGLLAARNVVASRVVRFLARRSLDGLRGVDTLIWALIWINVVGLGPFAGVLAIATSDVGGFGKLFSEAVEATDRRAGEGVLAAGGSAAHRVRFGLLPGVLPVLLSQVLYAVESNTRSATIIGIVGAGGVGLLLAEAIRTLEWQEVSFLVLLILAAVVAIDALSSRLRGAIIGPR